MSDIKNIKRKKRKPEPKAVASSTEECLSPAKRPKPPPGRVIEEIRQKKKKERRTFPV